MSETPDERIGQHDMCETAQITYRQLDYWTTAGYLVCEVSAPGQGHVRTWSAFERDVAYRMTNLIDAGFAASAAAKIARLATERMVAPHLEDLSPGKTQTAALSVLLMVDAWLRAEAEANR